MRRFMAFVLTHRVAVLAACGLLSVVAVGLLSRAVVASSMAKLFLGESPDYQRYLDNVRDHGSDEVIIVGIDVATPLTPGALDRLETAVRAVRGLPDAGRVTSMLDVPRFVAGDGGLTATLYPDAIRADPAAADAITRELCRDPLAGGMLISRRGDAIAVVVELSYDPDRPEEAAPLILESVLQAFTAAGYARSDLHPTGLVPVVSAIFSISYDTLERILPITALVLLGTLLLLFRRPWPVLVAGVVSVTGVLWTMGLAVWIDPHVNLLLAMVPAVVLIVSFSDVVHLCSAYLIELEDGRDKRDAILAAGADVGRACLLTSLTTFTGFVAMSMVPTPVFRMFGIVLGFGVGVTLLLALTLVPILLDLLPRPQLLHGGATAGARANRLLDRALVRMGELALRRPWWVIGAWALASALALAGVLRIHVETDLAARLAADHPLRLDQAWSEERFAGSSVMELLVRADPDQLGEPDLTRAVASYRDALEQIPGIDGTVSLLDLAEAAYCALEGLPRARSLAQLDDADLGRLELRLASAGGSLEGAAAHAGGLESLGDIDRGRLRLSMRLADEGFRGNARIGRAAGEAALRILGGRAEVEVTGIVYLLGSWLDEIVDAQRRSLIWTCVTIALMMVVGLRSVRAGLASMAPNLLPLLIVGGIMGACWERVDSDAFLIGLLAIGIGVDDTIHFLTRYRLEISRDRDRDAAVRRTFAFAGRGIVMTTVILTAGFLPMATSDYFTIRMFGTMLPLCLVVALAADLLLVPAMVHVGLIRFPVCPSPVAGNATILC